MLIFLQYPVIGHPPYYRGWLWKSFDETTSLDIDVRYDVYNIFVRDVDGTDTIILEHITDWPNWTKSKN